MPKIIYVDMDDVLCKFTSRSQSIKNKHPEIAFPQSLYGFFSNLEPMEDALDSLNYLNKQPQFDVYILTAPSIWNPLCYTEKRIWVEKYFGMDLVKKLIISPNKGLNRGDYLIDDHESGRGQETFEGKFLHFGGKEYPHWEAVIKYFVETYQLESKELG